MFIHFTDKKAKIGFESYIKPKKFSGLATMTQLKKGLIPGPVGGGLISGPHCN